MQVSLAEAARFWWHLGLVSFGGPAGQIALLHQELVERRRWLSEQRYLHALNYCMLLPGPEATQLATYLGWLLHGVPGGLIAGVLFLLPSVLVLTSLATIYALWGHLPLLAAVFDVLKPAVIAIVIVAAWRVGQRTLQTRLLQLLALLAFASLVVLQLPYPLVVGMAALIGWSTATLRPTWIQRRALEPAEPDQQSANPAHARVSPRRLALTLLAWGLATALPLAGLVHWGGWNGILPTMARFFSRVALLSFGGAYAVLPYVAQGAVKTFGWLNASQMIDGLALGETTPGPLIMVVAFVGFMGGWNQGLDGTSGHWPSAVAATLVTIWFTFVPSFGFILAGAPLVEASRNNLRLRAPLTAITAAVVGVIASLAALFARPVLWPAGRLEPVPVVIVLLALWVQLNRGWSVMRVMASAAIGGLGLAMIRGL